MDRDRILSTLFGEIQALVRRAERLRRDPTSSERVKDEG
jgi:hypothetical protein